MCRSRRSKYIFRFWFGSGSESVQVSSGSDQVPVRTVSVPTGSGSAVPVPFDCLLNTRWLCKLGNATIPNTTARVDKNQELSDDLRNRA